jgi:mannose-6-phosphate isomerase-like protein (cupin superfamily)
MTYREALSVTEVLEARTIYQDCEVSVARISLNGLNARTINRRSTTTYHIMKGDGVLEMFGQFREIHAGDTVTIPTGSPYQDEGELEMLAISIPPFDPTAIEYIG